MPCTITDPGHATNLTGVKAALALLDDPYRAPVPAEVVAVGRSRLTLALPGGALEARCHDAARLGAVLAAVRERTGAAPRALFTAHERQLLVEVEDDLVLPLGGTVYVAPAIPSGVVVAFNLALPWHADVPCAAAVAA